MIDVPEALRQRVRQRIAELLAAIFVVFPECQMDRIGRTLFDHIAARRVFLRFDTHARRKIVKVAADIGVRRIPRCPSHPTDEKRREGGRTKGSVRDRPFRSRADRGADILRAAARHMHDAAVLHRRAFRKIRGHRAREVHRHADGIVRLNSVSVVCEIDVVDDALSRTGLVPGDAERLLDRPDRRLIESRPRCRIVDMKLGSFRELRRICCRRSHGHVVRCHREGRDILHLRGRSRRGRR